MSEPVDPNASQWTPPEQPYTPPPAGAGRPQGEQQQPSSAAYPPPPAYPPPGYAPPSYPPPSYPSPDQQQYGAPGAGTYQGADTAPPAGTYGGYAQGYPQQGYPGAAYPQQGYPGMAPGSWQQPPPAKRSAVKIVVLAVIGVLVVGGVIAFVVGATTGDSSPKKLTPPHAIGNYTRLQSSAAQSVEQRLRSLGTAEGTPFFSLATLATYGADTGDVPNLIVAMLPTKQLPGASGHGSQEIVDQMFEGVAGPGQAQTMDAGSHGGALECSGATFGAAQETICAWSDKSTTGLVVSVNPALSTAALSANVQKLRDQVD